MLLCMEGNGQGREEYYLIGGLKKDPDCCFHGGVGRLEVEGTATPVSSVTVPTDPFTKSWSFPCISVRGFLLATDFPPAFVPPSSYSR